MGGRKLAAAYSGAASRRQVPPAEAAVGGTIGGGGVGAVIGGIAKGSKGIGPGALIGGAIGTVAGAAAHSARWNDAYQHAYNDCMGRGVSYGSSPEPWTEEWYAYCSAKYRSFNPDTGMFLAYGGRYRMCR